MGFIPDEGVLGLAFNFVKVLCEMFAPSSLLVSSHHICHFPRLPSKLVCVADRFSKYAYFTFSMEDILSGNVRLDCNRHLHCLLNDCQRQAPEEEMPIEAGDASDNEAGADFADERSEHSVEASPEPMNGSATGEEHETIR